MQIRLTRKLSQLLNGVDLSRRRVGDVIDLPRRDAELLLAEGWALTTDGNGSAPDPQQRADDAPRRSRKRRT